ncbi:siderophore-interacting protein [Isoptericola aurantiacus]|uniref:siderophore-interacting protein n=1 Tax=Isoptericola aurantiacus TaxID=3377839 RepID=UPI00383A1745
MTVPTSTPTTHRTLQPLHVRTLTVTAVTDLSATMRRIDLALADGDADVPAVPMAPTDHVKLAFPDDAGVLRVPTVIDDRPVRPDGPAPILRDYTVRAAGPGTLTIDMVTHEHGTAGRWAAAAAPGDRIASLGPRGSIHFPVGYRRYVLGADDTAIPAVARFLEELPADVEVEAVVEVADRSSEQPLPARENLALRWVHRTAGETLAEALRTARVTADTFVFVAGEARQLVAARRHLIRTLGVEKARVDVDGYWKACVADLDHHAPLDPDED